ncbi:MAG: branched-chain amino acid ABC transporter permease [Thermodesulfobacteriota bacterium]
MTVSDIVQLLISGIMVGGIYALMALGFHIIYAATRILNFAHGAVVLLGGLVALSLIEGLRLHVLVVLGCILVGGWVFGVLFNRVIIEPIKYTGHGIQIICLLAVSMVLENTAALVWGKEPLPFPPFPGSDRLIRIGEVSIQPQSVWILVLALLGLFATQLILKKTMIGKAIRATANNAMAARLMGIDIRFTYSVAFGIALSLGTLAGMIVSPVTFAGGYVAIPMTIKGFTASVLGGMAGSTSSIMGGFLLGIMEALTAGLVSTAYKEAIIMSLLLICLLVRPQGLFSKGGEG